MNKKILMREIIAKKRENSAMRKPFYATRKLSIGLVSCMLGFISLTCLPQSQVSYAADEPAATSISENVNTKENASGGGTADVQDETPSDPKVDNKSKEKENPTKLDKNNEGEVGEDKNLEEVDTKEKANSDKEKEEKEDKAVSEGDKKEEDPQKDTKETDKKEDKDKTKKAEDKKDEDKDKEAKAEAENREANGEAQSGKDISDSLENLVTKIRANTNNPAGNTVTPLRGPVNDNEGQDVGLDISFDVPATVKAGDYFEVKLSDSLNAYGATSKDVVYDPHLYVGYDVVAKGIYDPITNTFKYVFTKEAEKYGKFHQDINEVLFIDPKKVPNTKPDVDIFANLGSHNIANKVNVDYSLGLSEGDANIDSNGVGTINELDSKNGHYEQTYYVNYNGKTQHGTELTIKNFDKVEDNGKITESKAVFDQDVLNSVKVYRVKDSSKLNGSFYVDANDTNLEELDTSNYTKEIIPGGKGFKIKFKNENSTDTYVVKYKGKYDPKEFVQIESKVIADPTRPDIVANHITNISLKSGKSAPKADIGKFMEFHVYQTLNEDGSVKSTDYASDPENYCSGNTSQTYTTKRKDRNGYELFKVDRLDGAVADESGNEITSKFRAGKKDVVTYYYRKIQPNHTVWIDEEGNNVKNGEDGLKEKGDTPAGYTFVESKENEKQKDGSIKNTHIYHKVITNWVEENTGKVLKTKEDGAKPDTDGNDIENYKWIRTDTDSKTGDVTNVYKKITPKTSYVDEEGKEIPNNPTEEGEKAKKEIPGYTFVKTEKDPKTGETKHIYKKKVDIPNNPPTPASETGIKTKWIDEKGNPIKKSKEGKLEKGKTPDGYEFVETKKTKDGDIIHVYRKVADKATDQANKEVKQGGLSTNVKTGVESLLSPLATIITASAGLFTLTGSKKKKEDE